MIKELLFFTCLIAACTSAAIKTIQSELESKVQDNGIAEVIENEPSDLETAEGKHFGPRVVVVNQGYGNGGFHKGGGCNCGHSHSHSHHHFGKKK